MEQRKNQEIEINLGEIFYLLLSKLHIIILTGVIGMFCGYAFAKLALPIKYTSSISIFVNSSASDTVTENANQSDLTAAQSLAETYIVILDDDVVYDEVSEMLLEAYNASDLEKYFSITYSNGTASIKADSIRSLVEIAVVNETEVISITATTENAQLSADICTYIASNAPELLTRVAKAGSVESIGTAKVPTSPSSPDVSKITLIGLMLGLLAAICVIIIQDLVDNRIKTAIDFKKNFDDIPVLGEIPDLYSNKEVD